ncbi:hypothetical protein OB920_05290 [Halobacteria archaeon HArc-gm2]|nr:hypothetical protein [Halobacteria archaeon HArc-gm2]
MYEDYETGFARHKGGITKPYSQHLWDNRQIAIHWKDLLSADSEDYDGRGSTEISKLNDFAEEGRVVGASYRRITKTEMLVGVVEPDSPVKVLLFQEEVLVDEREIEPGESIPEYQIPNNARVLKALQLSDVRLVSIEDYPVIFESSVRPPFWSISNWENGEPHLRAIINDSNKPFKVSSLTPDEIEVVCEEFLRTVDDNYRSLATVGGQTADVDITGVSDENRIWGQVTMGDEGKVNEKLETLMQYSGESTGVLMFAPNGSEPQELPDGVTYLPVETVFETVALNESGQSMLEQMLNIPSTTSS